MSRDSDALQIEKWAATGDVQTPEDRGLDRSIGWPADFSQPGGRTPTREVFNQLFRELTALAVEINQNGILSWDTRVSYTHPAYVVGSDNRLYVSVRDSSGVDPTTDTAEDDWKPLVATNDGTIDDPGDLPNASTTERGVVELATNNETVTGTDETKAVTPKGLASRTATGDRAGLIELATEAEADDGTDASRAMTPSLVKRRVDAATPDATKTSRGLVELATNTETQTGTDDSRAVTPKGLASRTATTTRKGLVERATQVEADAGTDAERFMTPALVKRRIDEEAPPNASATIRGLVELATDAETQTGTDSQRAVTPAGLASRTATTARKGLVEKATQAEADTGTDTERYMTPALVKSRIDALLPTGTIIDYAGTTVPSGYLDCDGSAVSRTTYAALFAAIGTTWGSGDGSTTFNVPDLRRRTTIGSGGTRVSGPQTSVGNTGGAETHTLTVNEMPAHTHTYKGPSGASVTNAVSGFGGSNNTGSTGGGGAHNNIQPSAVVKKIIKA